MSNIPYWIIAILMLGLLVMVHELGHFIAGRVLGFKIIEFSIGFGPKLIQWKRKEIKYSIRAIPLGGYVQFFGEDADKPDEPGAMNNMPWWKRLIVLVSGVTCNLIFALLITVVLISSIGQEVATVSSINDGVPISQTILQNGDELVAVNNKEALNSTQLSTLISEAPDKNIILTIIHNGQKQNIVTDKTDVEGTMRLGIGIESKFKKLSFVNSVTYSFKYNVWMAEEMYKVLGQLVIGKVSLDSLSGPISTIGVIGDNVKAAAQEGAYAAVMMILNLLLVISINLAIFNILPIPALDGFRMLMVIIERIRKKAINRDLEAKINFAGFAILIGLVVALEIYKLVIHL